MKFTSQIEVYLLTAIVSCLNNSGTAEKRMPSMFFGIIYHIGGRRNWCLCDRYGFSC